MTRIHGLRLGLAAVACAMFVGLASTGWAQTLELQIDNTPSSNILDGYYVGAYNAANLTSGGSTQIIADDFFDRSNYNAANYTVNTFSTLGNTLFGSFLLGTGSSMAQVTTLYEEAAWLAVGMLGQSGTQQGYYSYAIWAMFDPSGVAQWLSKYGDSAACNAVFGSGSWSGWGCNASTTNKGGLVELAMSQKLSVSEFANVHILTPKGCSSWGGALLPGSCPEQEFFQVVSEGGTSAAYLLLAGFACLAGIVFRSRLQTTAA